MRTEISGSGASSGLNCESAETDFNIGLGMLPMLFLLMRINFTLAAPMALAVLSASSLPRRRPACINLCLIV